MSEREFIEDDIDRMLYNRVPTSGSCFESIGLLGAIFTQWIKERKLRKQEKLVVEQKSFIPANKVESIKV